MKKIGTLVLGLIALFGVLDCSYAQELDGVYFRTVPDGTNGLKEELKIHRDYLVLSVYETSPPKFIKTLGGFFEHKNDSLFVNLEFNSNYKIDSIQSIKVPISEVNGELILDYPGQVQTRFKRSTAVGQVLDGQWLFGTRGPDTGQERRGDSKTRKTLKFLLDGRFQWIAYDTNGLEFKGTGGGSYSTANGKYTENIEYFSRDNKRVGASLEFIYDLNENDWHHQGNNSKGEPMYEIWQKREE